MENAALLTDGYKLGHRNQYPQGTEFVYSNWTPRSNKFFPEAPGAVVFGIQYLCKKYFQKYFDEHFFNLPKEEVVNNFKQVIDEYLGENNVGTEHIEALHDLGYLPIQVKSLPEGTICPIRVPAMTIINTLPEFFWVTNFLETIISNVLWMPMTSATTAYVYKQELKRHAELTGFTDIDFLCHDFSMRGISGLDSAIASGMAHLTSFVGSETIPAIQGCKEYYNAKWNVAATVPATEHSVMCAGGQDDEFETFKRLITEVYPKGFVSIVSDTWDLWQVITDFLPRLKDDILARDGRVVIRPDSGVPEDIICGTNEAHFDGMRVRQTPEQKGAYELLWDIFGGTINEKGYKVLNPKIGLLYGDSITLEKQCEIYTRLEKKGFAATNLVLGIGSYTYQFKTRDTLGFAMKATWCQINGDGKEIFKNPKTDDGIKKSLKGLIRVDMIDEKIVATDCVSKEQESGGLLETVFENGVLIKEVTFDEIRERLCKQ